MRALLRPRDGRLAQNSKYKILDIGPFSAISTAGSCDRPNILAGSYSNRVRTLCCPPCSVAIPGEELPQ